MLSMEDYIFNRSSLRKTPTSLSLCNCRSETPKEYCKGEVCRDGEWHCPHLMSMDDLMSRDTKDTDDARVGVVVSLMRLVRDGIHRGDEDSVDEGIGDVGHDDGQTLRLE